MRSIMIITFLVLSAWAAPEVEKVKDSNTSDLFKTSLILGVQLQPSYNSNNENEGFKKSTLYAKVNIDNRFSPKNNLFFLPSNYGMDLEYLGTPVEKNVTTPSAPTSFNDVSKTFQAIAYASVNLVTISEGSQIGLLGQYGLMTRDIKDQNENTINGHFGVGLEYVYSDLSKESYNKQYPIGKFSIVRRKYDFFAGKEGAWRTVADFEYKRGIYLIGFNANMGDREDTMFLKFGIVKALEEVGAFFFPK